MSLAMVLDLDPVSARDVGSMVQRGLLRAGRVSPRGAYVYELTNEGAAVIEACAEVDVSEAVALAEECKSGECEHAHEARSEGEQRAEARARADWLYQQLVRVQDILVAGASAAKLQTPAYVTEALAALREECPE